MRSLVPFGKELENTTVVPVMKTSKSDLYRGKIKHWDDLGTFIQPCVDFMVARINEKISLIEVSNHLVNRSIKLGE